MAAHRFRSDGEASRGLDEDVRRWLAARNLLGRDGRFEQVGEP